MSDMSAKDLFSPYEEGADDVTGMISELHEQALQSYRQYLAAAAIADSQTAWDRYNEGLELEKDIDTLLYFYGFANREGVRRLPRT
jgi:hypothetical protein